MPENERKQGGSTPLFEGALDNFVPKPLKSKKLKN